MRLTWTKKLSDQLNLAHVGRKKLKYTNASALSSVQCTGSRFVEARRNQFTFWLKSELRPNFSSAKGSAKG